MRNAVSCPFNRLTNRGKKVITPAAVRRIPVRFKPLPTGQIRQHPYADGVERQEQERPALERGDVISIHHQFQEWDQIGRVIVQQHLTGNQIEPNLILFNGLLESGIINLGGAGVLGDPTGCIKGDEICTGALRRTGDHLKPEDHVNDHQHRQAGKR